MDDSSSQKKEGVKDIPACLLVRHFLEQAVEFVLLKLRQAPVKIQHG